MISSSEKFYFNLFKGIYKNLPVGLIQYPINDPPDIVVSNKKHTLGIEITTIYKDDRRNGLGSALKKQESIQNQLLQNVIKNLKANNIKPLEIHTSYSVQNKISENQFRDIVQTISNLIIEYLDQINNEQKTQYIKIEDRKLLPDCLDSISFIKSPYLTKFYSSSITSDFQPDLSYNLLEKVIKEKENKMDGCFKELIANWLLIIEEGSISSHFNNVAIGNNDFYKSRFNKILLFRYIYGKILELK